MNIQFFPYKKGGELKAFINTITQDSFGDLSETTLKAGLHGVLELVKVEYPKEKPDGVMVEGFIIEGVEEYDVYLLADTYTEERATSSDTLEARMVTCLVVANVPFVAVSWSPEESEPERTDSCEIDEEWGDVDDMDEYLSSLEEEGPHGPVGLPIGMFYPDND